MGSSEQTEKEQAGAARRKMRVLVTGCGFMGEGIASVFAAYGHDVVLHDIRGASFLQTVKERIWRAVEEYRRAGGHGEEDRVFDFVFEAAFEDLEVKCSLYEELAARFACIRDGRTPVCSNTSSLLLADMKARLCRGENGNDNRLAVAIAHFVGPALFMPVVEVICAFLSSCGKRPVRMRKEVPGFVHARLQACLLRECISLLKEGVCSGRDIDDTVTYGFGRRYNQVGPLAQGDLVGLDLIAKTHAGIFPSLCNDAADEFTASLVKEGKRGGKDLDGQGQHQQQRQPERPPLIPLGSALEEVDTIDHTPEVADDAVVEPPRPRHLPEEKTPQTPIVHSVGNNSPPAPGASPGGNRQRKQPSCTEKPNQMSPIMHEPPGGLGFPEKARREDPKKLQMMGEKGIKGAAAAAGAGGPHSPPAKGGWYTNAKGARVYASPPRIKPGVNNVNEEEAEREPALGTPSRTPQQTMAITPYVGGSPQTSPSSSTQQRSPINIAPAGAGHLASIQPQTQSPTSNSPSTPNKRHIELGLAGAHHGPPSVARLLHAFLQTKDHPPGCWQAPFSEADLTWLLTLVRSIFLEQPSLLELGAPVTILGDLHGQFHDLLRLFELVGYPTQKSFLFLGDYVDRGKNSLDVVTTLFCYKVQYPYNTFLLRGNHETAATSRCYGFYDEVKRRCSVKMWRRFVDVFNCMPPSALVGGRILCMHGGLSEQIELSLDPIRRLQRPCECNEAGLLADLLWADPCPKTDGWRPSDRGISQAFGADVVKRICERHDLDLVCRAHQVVQDGYEFFAGRSLITVFSAPNYFGEYDNAAGVLEVSERMLCSVKTLQPVAKHDYVAMGAADMGMGGRTDHQDEELYRGEYSRGMEGEMAGGMGMDGDMTVSTRAGEYDQDHLHAGIMGPQEDGADDDLEELEEFRFDEDEAVLDHDEEAIVRSMNAFVLNGNNAIRRPRSTGSEEIRITGTTGSAPGTAAYGGPGTPIPGSPIVAPRHANGGSSQGTGSPGGFLVETDEEEDGTSSFELSDS
eukprot:g17004.t1